MKTIGIIGGMSWESTVTYYKIINALVREKLGGLHSAKILLASVDFDEIERLQRESKWREAGRILGAYGQGLEAAGADFLLIGANTMHLCAGDVAAMVKIPILHIADATSRIVRREGVRRVALLGTRYTMEQDFLKSRLKEGGLDIVVPAAEERAEINRIIYEELCCGKVLESSRSYFRSVIGRLCKDESVEGVILGCTEIDLIVTQADSPVPVFDTTEAHARAAVELALE